MVGWRDAAAAAPFKHCKIAVLLLLCYNGSLGQAYVFYYFYYDLSLVLNMIVMLDDDNEWTIIM